MADAFDAMEEAYHLEDYAEVAQQDEVFHGIYIHNTGNGRLEAMLDGLKDSPTGCGISFKKTIPASWPPGGSIRRF